MYGYIILRDIPKEAAQLDLSIYEIKGGFRGFAQVPSGAHYATVKVNDEMIDGFWCYSEPSSVVVKVYDYEENKFKDDDPENEEHYSRLALSGAMNKALIHVMVRDAEVATLWTHLVSRIGKENFPPRINSKTPMMPPDNIPPKELNDWYVKIFKSRFEQAFYDTHEGDIFSFMAEFQFVFTNSLIIKSNEVFRSRWLDLLQAIYNAGERSIEATPNFFSEFIDILIPQFKLLPNDWFTKGSKVINKAEYLIEDMIDTKNEMLVNKALTFANYSKSRNVSF